MSENPNRTQVLHQTSLYSSNDELYKAILFNENKAPSNDTKVYPVNVKKLAPLSNNPQPNDADQISESFKNPSL
jgi:hypothetical protein